MCDFSDGAVKQHKVRNEHMQVNLLKGQKTGKVKEAAVVKKKRNIKAF